MKNDISIEEKDSGRIVISKVIKKDMISYEISHEEYELLQEISKKYNIPLDMVLEIILIEGRAVKKGFKKAPIKDISQIINKYAAQEVGDR